MAFDPENPFYNVGVDFAARVQEMIAAAAEEGITLVLASGYRTDEDQQGLFEDNYVLDPAGTIEWPAGSGQMWRQTGTLVAPPGSSLHELGHAMDFAVAADPAAAEWITANAERFDLRNGANFSTPEPGHVAPLGVHSYSDIPAGAIPEGITGGGQGLGPDFDAAVQAALGDLVWDDGTGEQITVDDATAGGGLGPASADALLGGDEPVVEAGGDAPAAETGDSTEGGAASTSDDGLADSLDARAGLGAYDPDVGGMGVAEGDLAVGFGYPSGGKVYDVGGKRFVVYEVTDAANLESAMAHIYYEVTKPEEEVGLGAGTQMSTSAWTDMTADYIVGGGANVLLDEDHVGRTWAQIVHFVIDGMNMVGTDATADAGIIAGLAALIADPDMGEAEQAGLWLGTDWWNDHTELQLDWNDFGTATKNVRIEKAAVELLTVYEYYTGIPADTSFMYGTDGQFSIDSLQTRNPTLYQHAFDVASGATTQIALVGSWAKADAVDIAQSPHNRRLEEEERLQGMRDMGIAEARSLVTDLYEKYGLSVSNYTVSGNIDNLYMNKMSLDDIETTVKTHSLAMYPNKPVDMTWGDYANPFQDTFASLLELPRPGFRDPTLGAFLKAPVTEGGAAPNVYDFEKQLRRDPRWEGTRNAKESYHSVFGQIGRLMGF